MENTLPSSGRKTLAPGFIPMGDAVPFAQMGRLRPTSVVLHTATNAKRQHNAIGKLLKMCKASPVVDRASQGITAEVRKDRDRGHE